MFMINNKLDEVYQYDNDIDDDDTSSLSISNKRYQLNNGLKKKVLLEPFYHMIIHFKIPNKDKIQR